MKNLMFGLLVFFLAMGCTKPYPGFVLQGKVKGMESGKLYLVYTDSLGNQIRDSAMIKNGKFGFRGGISEPTNAWLAKSLGMSMDENGFIACWLEPGVMSVEFSAGDMKNYVLTGSVTNDEEQLLKKQQEPVMKEMEALQQAYRDEKNHEKAAAIKEQMEPYYDQMAEIARQFIKQHPDSYVSVQQLYYKTGSMTYEDALAAYNGLSDRVKNSRTGVELQEEIEKLRMGSPGSPAAVFSKTDINGKQFDMAGLKGKYVILDFWASWCVPCRKSNPHLKELYEKYKADGLEVVCVADDDRNEEKWKAAVEKDGIGMFKHVLRGLEWTDGRPDRTNDISELYGIHSLPTKILIDREGIIVGRYGGGGGTQEDMDQKLKEIFGK